MSRIVESLYRVSGIALNEMALNEMPIMDTSNNRDSYKYHLKTIKDIFVYIQQVNNSPSKDDIKHIYSLLKRELLFDIEYNAKYWEGNRVNTDSLCKIYDKCIHLFGDMYEKIFKNTSYWDKKYYELYDLLADLESKSGLGIKYSRKLKNGLNEGAEEISILNTSKFLSVCNKLQDKFGLNFNKKPICSEVCDFLTKINPKFNKVECSVYIKDGTDFIPISSHHSVILNDNEVLDFTNQQYNNYEEYGHNMDCPRIFKRVKDNIYANGNMILALK